MIENFKNTNLLLLLNVDTFGKLSIDQDIQCVQKVSLQKKREFPMIE